MGRIKNAAPVWRGMLALTAALMLAACEPSGAAQNALTTQSTERPMRIVSLDYCADQYLLQLADREQILAISPGGVEDFSYMRDAAIGMPTVRPNAEDVLILEPDLIIRSYGGGPNAAGFFERAGVPVLQLGWISSIDGAEEGSIAQQIAHVADGLGQSERGAALTAEFRSRLAAIRERSSDAATLYMTPAGVTSGPGSLIHEMLIAAGLSNFQEESGWHSLPLERLAYEQPDLVAAAFFDSFFSTPDAWGAAQHPVARAQLTDRDVVPLDGAWTACGGWFILDAVEALAEGARR